MIDITELPHDLQRLVWDWYAQPLRLRAFKYSIGPNAKNENCLFPSSLDNAIFKLAFNTVARNKVPNFDIFLRAGESTVYLGSYNGVHFFSRFSGSRDWNYKNSYSRRCDYNHVEGQSYDEDKRCKEEEFSFDTVPSSFA